MGTDLRALRCGVRTPIGARDFFSLLQIFPDCLWGPPSLVFNGYLGYFLVLNGPEGETDHSSQSSADVQNHWSMGSDSCIFLLTSCCESGRNFVCSFIQLFTKLICWVGKVGTAFASIRAEPNSMRALA